MQIAALNFNSYPNYQKSKENQTFTGYRSAFSRNLDAVLLKHRVTREDAKNLSDLLTSFLDKHLHKNYLLGAGFHGRVYKLDDKYAIKVPNTRADLFFFENIPKRKFGALKTYYGETVANFTDAKILRNVSSTGSHTQVGVPERLLLTSYPDERLAYYYNIYLPKFADVPQRAFDAIAKDFDTLNKMGRGAKNYTFDFQNPNNFVLVGNTLRITDCIALTSVKNPNTMAEMLDIFLTKMNINSFADYSIEAEQPRKTLLKKIILAGMKCNLDIGTCGADRVIWTNIIENICNLKVSGDGVISTLQEYQKLFTDTKLRLKFTNDYLDSICNV